MKTWITGLLCLLSGLAFAQQNDFKITGNVKGAGKDAKVILSYSVGRTTVTDSVLVKHNKFQFGGSIQSPVRAKLILIKGGGTGPAGLPDELPIYLSGDPIMISAKDSLKHASMKGSKLNTDYQVYRAFLKEADDELFAVNQKWQSLTLAERENFGYERSSRTRTARALRRKLMAGFADKHPESYFALMALNDLSIQNVDVPLVSPLFDKLSPALKETEIARRLKQRIDLAALTVVGAIAPDFEQADVNDKPVKLSDFRGQYILVDFWASWCGPCRAENPNLVAAYNQYKDRGFTILGVSLDNPGKKQAWLDAIAKDGLEWTQVSDLKGWGNEVAKLYSITSVPSSFLIDPDGKIIAVNLTGERLHTMLERVLN